MAKLPGYSSIKVVVCLLLCVCAATGARGADRQRVRTEREVKALLFVTLARYIDWPAEVFSTENSPIILGVIGEDPFGDLLESLTAGEEVRGRRLQITHLTSAEDLKGCHLLYFGNMTTLRQEVELARIGARPVVTVCDKAGFTRKGGMIEMYLNEEKKVRLRISQGVVERSKVTISPALLRQADLVASMEYIPDVPFWTVDDQQREPAGKRRIAMIP